MLGKGEALSNQAYQGYGGPLTAGQSGLQTQAFQGLAGLTLPTAQMGGFNPTSFTSGTTAQDYMSPLVQTSIEPQIAEAQRQAAAQAESERQAKKSEQEAQARAEQEAKRVADAKAAVQAKAAAEAAAAQARAEAEAAAALAQSNEPVSFTASSANWASAPNFSFPERAARRARSGDTLNVVLVLRVNKQGGIDNVRVAQSSGNPLLDKEARRQVRSGKFKPFTKNGVPVVGDVTLPISYAVP